MLDTPTTADEYPPGQLELVKATGLSLVVALGDLANDVVVVGGLVPALFIPPSPDSAHRETYAHSIAIQVVKWISSASMGGKGSGA